MEKWGSPHKSGEGEISISPLNHIPFPLPDLSPSLPPPGSPSSASNDDLMLISDLISSDIRDIQHLSDNFIQRERERERKIEENRSRRTYVHNKYYIIYTISKKIDTSTKTIKLML